MSALSLGTQKKFFLSAAYLADTDVIILDEPTNAIDNTTKQRVYQWINEQVQQGKTVISASHDKTYLVDLAPKIIDLESMLLSG